MLDSHSHRTQKTAADRNGLPAQRIKPAGCAADRQPVQPPRRSCCDEAGRPVAKAPSVAPGGSAVPSNLNPFTQLGAIANTCLLIALISGIALLIWYVPSVHQAYASLETIKNASWLGQWVRSLHRYSSDACMLMILLHAGQIFLTRRFTGGRKLAWMTGVVLLGLVWLLGWTGYWLVWDVRAQHVAIGSAKLADSLPIFVEPLSRSFLTNTSVPSLLFFLIFFAHMLLPLVVGIALWIHLMRVGRARILTGRAMTYWVVGTLVVLSTVLPATSAAPADMTAKAQRFTMDWWYLWPVALSDRLGGGALWLLFLSAALLMFATPWWMRKRILNSGRRSDSAQPADSVESTRNPIARCALGFAAVIGLSAVTYLFSNLPYQTPLSIQPELVVSFNHRGQPIEQRALTREELEKRLPHMRAQFNVTREKSPVRLRVTIDNEIVLDRSYLPRGLSKDGPSIALVRLPVETGARDVRVELADTPDQETWTHEWHGPIKFQSSRAQVLLFDTRSGFSLH